MWKTLLALASRLRFLAARRRLCDEASQEMQSHLELLTARYVASGMAPDEGRLAARRRIGNVALVREDIYQMNSVRWVEALVHDVRHACRVFARNPSFAAVVILTLALGIGANVAILTVVYSVLLKPLPYEHPGQIYSVEVVVPERRDQIPSLPATIQAYIQWRNAHTVFSGVSALTPWEATITGDGESERLGGARVSANFFAFLGVPIQGSGLSVEQEQRGNDRVVVISDALWRSRFGSDATLIGRKIVLNGESHLVVGIAPSSLLVPTGTQLHALVAFAPRIDIWKPIAPAAEELNNESWDHGVLVRLPNGANLAQGRQQLETVLNDMIRAQVPAANTQVVVQLVPAREIYAAKVRLRLLLLLAASALLLLTACASLANLLLARVISRTNEFATRIALGAGRARIVSQTLTETSLLAMVGGVIATVFARYGARVLASHGPDDVRLLVDTRVGLLLLLFASTVSLLTGLVCGIVPAWQAYRRDTRAELQGGLRTVGSGVRARGARQVLVGVEVALATVLLVSAGLLLRSFVKVMTADRGYDIEHIVAMEVSPSGERYEAPAGRTAFYNELVERVRGLPGVVSAGAISNLPALSASDGASRTIFYTSDTNFDSLVLARPVAVVRSVTEGYFAASGTSLRAGRFLTGDEPVPTAVISQSLASRLWPREPPTAVVGRHLRQGDVTGPLIAVAGVVADAQPGGFDREALPAIYRPYRQWPSGRMTLIVKTAQNPSALAGALRSELKKLDRNMPISALRTMRDIVSSSVAQRRFQTVLTSLFALLSLLLGMVGVYGVVSYAVASRTRDIGIRIALGALRVDVMRWMFASGMRPVLAGLAAGLIGAVTVATAVRGVLFEVTPTDPISLGTVALLLLFASAIACYLPARRAAALDPIIALRHE
jgi:putative ABC transport system permease protein